MSSIGRACAMLPDTVASGSFASRFRTSLTRLDNWVQLGKFALVGASGYVVNVAVYALLLRVAGLDYLAAAFVSFLIAVLNNYTWNRQWTFRDRRLGVASQGARFFVVSSIGGGLTILLLYTLVVTGTPKLPAQALAVALVTPANFLGNKLWTFRNARADNAPEGVPRPALSDGHPGGHP